MGNRDSRVSFGLSPDGSFVKRINMSNLKTSQRKMKAKISGSYYEELESEFVKLLRSKPCLQAIETLLQQISGDVAVKSFLLKILLNKWEEKFHRFSCTEGFHEACVFLLNRDPNGTAKELDLSFGVVKHPIPGKLSKTTEHFFKNGSTTLLRSYLKLITASGKKDDLIIVENAGKQEPQVEQGEKEESDVSRMQELYGVETSNEKDTNKFKSLIADERLYQNLTKDQIILCFTENLHVIPQVFTDNDEKLALSILNEGPSKVDTTVNRESILSYRSNFNGKWDTFLYWDLCQLLQHQHYGHRLWFRQVCKKGSTFLTLSKLCKAVIRAKIRIKSFFPRIELFSNTQRRPRSLYSGRTLRFLICLNDVELLKEFERLCFQPSQLVFYEISFSNDRLTYGEFKNPYSPLVHAVLYSGELDEDHISYIASHDKWTENKVGSFIKALKLHASFDKSLVDLDQVQRILLTNCK